VLSAESARVAQPGREGRGAATVRVDAALRAAIRALHADGVAAGATVLVGVSGGQDSLCLAHALWRLKPEHGWLLRALHVDHGIRPEAADEADYVAATCAAWGLPLTVVRLDVPEYQRRERLNVQEAARYARYQAFAREVVACGAAGAAVAHTADDVAETLLLHLMRGAGLDGLAAMPLRRTLPGSALGPSLDGAPLPTALVVLRPLLGVARADTAAYCAEHALRPVGEPPGHYRRDQVRGELLPALERYNPAVRRALAATATALAEDRAALDTWAHAVADRCRVDHEGIEVPLGEWQALPVAVRKRVLRLAAELLGGPPARLGQRHLEAALRLADGQAGRGIGLPAGLRLERAPDALHLRRQADRRSAPIGPWLLPVPGAVVLPGVGLLRAERHSAPPPALAAAPAAECWLDAAAAAGPLGVRFRQPGDHFQPLGMSQEKRVQDFLVDARVPRAMRDQLPLVIAGGRIVWVAGQRIAAWARVCPDSAVVLHLVFEPDGGSMTGDGSGGGGWWASSPPPPLRRG
jgi:tRNA(Ile)-lysidine synthase